MQNTQHGYDYRQIPHLLLIKVALSCFLLLACGCVAKLATPPPDPARFAIEHGLVLRHLAAPPFVVLALIPAQTTGQTLRVYIEGDGRAWLTRERISPDPTPTTSLVLDLLATDPFPNKAYLARPCQYVQSSACTSQYWTDRRYAPEVIASMHDALNQLKDAGGYRSLELIGYSGGGTVAALLAAQRADVVMLRTIAGNLDHVWLNKHHRVSPLAGSLNPVDFAASLASVPQRHFLGEHDAIVPPEMYQIYSWAFPHPNCLAVTVVPGADHATGWQEHWVSCLLQPPGCAKDASM